MNLRRFLETLAGGSLIGAATGAHAEMLDVPPWLREQGIGGANPHETLQPTWVERVEARSEWRSKVYSRPLRLRLDCNSIPQSSKGFGTWQLLHEHACGYDDKSQAEGSDLAAHNSDPKAFFDDYVRRVFPERRAAAGADWQWPGDEWANTDLREATWRRIIGECDPSTLHEIVEIGPGSGKYTEMALVRTPAHLTVYEISGEFLESLARRCADATTSGRLDARRIAWTDNEGLLRDYGPRLGTADLWFAIDVLMMMDFQSALVYLISAASMLRPGGRLVATFADGGTESGLTRMLRDAGRHSAFDAAACTRFHWIDRSLLEAVLPALGFGRLRIEHGPDDGLDIARLYLQAELMDAEAGRALAAKLTPQDNSTNRRAQPRAWADVRRTRARCCTAESHSPVRRSPRRPLTASRARLPPHPWRGTARSRRRVTI